MATNIPVSTFATPSNPGSLKGQELSGQLLRTKSDPISQFSSKTIDSQELDLARALSRIAEKCVAPERDPFVKEMEGFKELFSRFKNAKGKAIEWEKIKVKNTRCSIKLTFQ